MVSSWKILNNFLCPVLSVFFFFFDQKCIDASYSCYNKFEMQEVSITKTAPNWNYSFSQIANTDEHRTYTRRPRTWSVKIGLNISHSIWPNYFWFIYLFIYLFIHLFIKDIMIYLHGLCHVHWYNKCGNKVLINLKMSNQTSLSTY